MEPQSGIIVLKKPSTHTDLPPDHPTTHPTTRRTDVIWIVRCPPPPFVLWITNVHLECAVSPHPLHCKHLSVLCSVLPSYISNILVVSLAQLWTCILECGTPSWACFPFLSTSTRIDFETVNGIIQSGNRIIQTGNGIISTIKKPHLDFI